MDFGGKTTVLGVKLGTLHRLPASYFVSVSYMCWADRRRSLVWKDGQATIGDARESGIRESGNQEADSPIS
jgi:fumarate hydratase class I